ncbi:hypothetical protein V6N11_020438 [Hibiscus sabdariffa]|uniref:Uncharacterized protein n=1 Tax=Hibiscus sabdariffa TaxID=183260 RepID=A0ABR2Q8F7_9ROSI
MYHVRLSHCLQVKNLGVENLSEKPKSHKEWVVKPVKGVSKDVGDPLSLPLASIEVAGASSSAAPVTEIGMDPAIQNLVTIHDVTVLVGNVTADDFGSVVDNIGQICDSSTEIAEASKAILDSNAQEFPSLQDSIQVKKVRGKDRKDDPSKGGFASSKNNFDVLNGLGSEDFQSKVQIRKPRAAAMGVANLLQEMKAKKKDNLDKIKRSSVEATVQTSSVLDPTLSS